MNEIDQTKLSGQRKFRLDEIKKIENYFNSEINQRKLCSKKLSKYVTTFNYMDKIWIILNTRTEGLCIISHATVVGAPVEIANARFTVVFSLAIGIIKNYQKQQETKSKSMIKFLFWLRVNSIALKL